MPTPTGPERIAAAERELGFALPASLTAPLLAGNGGELLVPDYPGDRSGS
ncbi:SMI1/KNR4 family protein [Candidatus Solirubrobacter pratensis]|nr:SMI1/KNR4 family protein [Candidatus Solirubrobacter pratensis]